MEGRGAGGAQDGVGAVSGVVPRLRRFSRKREHTRASRKAAAVLPHGESRAEARHYIQKQKCEQQNGVEQNGRACPKDRWLVGTRGTVADVIGIL